MNPQLRISYEPQSCIVTFEDGFKSLEGHGETLVEALVNLANEVELDGYTLSYITEVTGVAI